MSDTHEKRQGKFRYKVWMEQAKWDIEAAEISIQNEFYEWATFQCQQSAEKTLKAVLVHAGWAAPRIHKLSVLYGMCRQANSGIRKTFIEYRDLESFTFLARYPFLMPGKNACPHNYISKEDADLCLVQCQSIYSKIRALLGE